MPVLPNYPFATPFYLPLFTGEAAGANAPTTWLDNRHPDWQKNWWKWTYARDVYTGEVLDPTKLGSYLLRKGQGETLPAYFERQALADFTSHFGVCVDALAGMLFHVEDDATRNYGELGLPDNPSSIIGSLFRNADGDNTGYTTIWKQLAIELVVTHWHWMLVDVVGGAPRVTLIEPERVVDWDEDDDGLLWARVKENVVARTGPTQPATQVEQYCVITRQGWQRYREQKDQKNGKTVVVTVGKAGTHRYEDATGKLQLPIFRVKLPLRRNVGYPMAKKNVAIFNKESERDQLLRTANFPKFVVVGDDELFAKISKQVGDGAFMVQDDPHSQKSHRFDAPPTQSVTAATSVIDQKTTQFYKSFFREYANATRGIEKTATEILQDVHSGVGAFLQMLKAGLDDAENQTFWRLEQAVHPNDRAKWYKARVERSDNFQPLQIDEAIERMRVRYFGQTGIVPVGRKAILEVLRQIAAWDGLPFDEAEMQESLDNNLLVDTQALLPMLPLPAGAKAKLAVQWLMRLGVVDPTEGEALIAQATAVAEAEQAQKQLLAQPLGPPSPDTAPRKPVPTKTKTTRLTTDPKTGEKIAVTTEG